MERRPERPLLERDVAVIPVVLLGCPAEQPAPTSPYCPGWYCPGNAWWIDDDRDGYPLAVDCADHDPSHHPDASDPPGDGLDQDCSGTDLDATPLGGSTDWESPVAYARAGRMLSPGDVDGDGRDELVVSGPGPVTCPFEDFTPPSCVPPAPFGHVWVVGWNDGWTERGAWVGSGHNIEAIGEYVDGQGDVDGDGLHDVLFGSLDDSRVFLGPGPWGALEEASVTNPGWSYVKSSVPDDDDDGAAEILVTNVTESADFLIVYRDVVAYGAGPDTNELSLSSEQDRTELARTPPAFPDLDGDGAREWLFGAMFHRRDDGVAVGAAHAAPSGLSGELELADVAWTWMGTSPEAEAGLCVANAGDVDGDGDEEGLVSAPLDDLPAPHAGRVFLVDGLPRGEPALDDGSLVVEGELADDWLGWRMTGPVDVDLDGFADLVLGAPGDYYLAPTHPGKVHLLLGPLSGTVSAAEADHTWLGDERGAHAGTGLALGDFDGDATVDLAVGAPDATTDAGDDAGKVHLLLGFGALD